jgi:arylsulfatase A-like enzyme
MTKNTKTSLFTILLLTGLMATLLSSCHLVPSTTPSIIVIAVDQLGVNELSCTSESTPQMRSGIALLCEESIRFTHAFTTSPLSGPALTSILTAQYPYEHGLRSNTKSSLPSRVTTLTELAQQKNYVTSFFSGGAPVLRKLNLQQGFETFDDNFVPTPGRLFRSFQKTQKIFESWLNEIGRQSFLTFFYVPDIAFTQTPTQTLLGENRNLSYESQLEEFDDSLFTFIQSLKARKLWDSTMVVLVGLNGPVGEGRETELANLNLFSERTQVGLLIKPSQKPRDRGVSWSYDDNVTLADVGATLAEMFGSLPSNPTFPVTSLTKALQNPSAQLLVNRPIVTESAWSETNGIRYGVRWGQYLFLLDEKPLLYNSLIDKQETSPIRISEAGAQKEWEEIQNIMANLQWKFWPGLPHDEFLKWKGLADLWSMDLSPNREASFERLAHRLRDVHEVTDLYSRELLNQQNWPELERWAQGLKLPDLEKIALKNLKKDNKKSFSDPCLAVLEMSHPGNGDLKKCEDPMALTLLEWVLAERKDNSDNPLKDALRKRFLRQYLSLRLDRKIIETNYSLQAAWDLAPSLKTKHLTVEMMLSLPEMQKFRQLALKAAQQSKDD